ncbi:MAG: Gfo/Idh/MocA family oxidoreductase [Gammaproteobacteria bacterium]|nr:Gfo/Idh/MocA family oxidoreductase [Gammaproteobacteria bacterium]
MTEKLKLGVLGIDHPHIFGMLKNMQKHGCDCELWWTDGHAFTAEQFSTTFPDVKQVADRKQIIDDPDIDMVLISAVPEDRAGLAIEAMRAGKDVMVDKPGCTTLEQLQSIKDCVSDTGRIWTVNFSERFEVPAVVKAEELVANGAIGNVIQTIGTGPHHQGLNKRPDWFYRRQRFGGILCDIGSHQVDQFLFFTGSTEATVSHALVQNTTLPEHPEFQDFGEMVLTGNQGHGYVRVDWFTPDGLGVWGDGRLTILGDKGYIELRKYIDVARSPQGNNLYLVNDSTAEYIDCNTIELTYSPRLINDVLHRTETAVTQKHTFRTMELALQAQQKAELVRAS